VSLVAVLDADKEGFLRSTRSLIQTCGRAARNVNGRVILYADHVTESMRRAIAETDRRREIQRRYNEDNGITPQTVKANIRDLSMAVYEADYVTVPAGGEGAEYQPDQIPAIVAELEAEMRRASEALEFEKAAGLRDRILALKDLALGVPAKATGMKGLLGSGANLLAAAAMGGARGGPRRPQAMRRRRR
jgi:excinuclease ABC subunit B